MKGIIYKFTSPSGKSYIGQTNQGNKRYSQHAKSSKSKDGKFQRAIRKYGFENFFI